ncbi:F-box/LRR-repeat protein 12-like [Papaver somniferum]|uniref:F-box/LRR-repeat protein 12-like n=1 Tax=Papaver somniferum TaxID=3469 RepID=UPI000E702320|nr:F-box/LRR-repeat protein 12-like [Papaver somniferum]
MSLLSNGKYNQGSGKIPTSKAVQDGDDGYRRPRKIRRTSCSITNLPNDCLNLIFKFLETRGDRTKTRDDRNSFGLTCRQWLHIQNNNQESLWYLWSCVEYPRISHEIFPMVLCELLTRFQNIKNLGLSGRPKITDFVTSKPPFSGSKVQYLCLDYCYEYSDIELSILFSWLPRLTYISLSRSCITDKCLEALAECCSSLKKVELPWCDSITDSGISFLLQNCGELASLCISFCSKITGIGFLGCPKTLTKLEAIGCKFKPEGKKAIVNGGGMNHLILSAGFGMAGGGCIDTEAVMTIS